MKAASLPLIKEHRISKLIEALTCIDKYPFNRKEQRDCILRLYPGKSEKSVFRGMIIPSLRHLGLIMGFGRAIRISSNGKILVVARNTRSLPLAAKIVFLEIDRKKFGFIQRVISLSTTVMKDKFLSAFYRTSANFSVKQIEERVNAWLSILEDCRLIETKDNMVRLRKENYQKADSGLRIEPKRHLFKGILFSKYKSIRFRETAGIVDIAVLRELVALQYFKRHGMVLTEAQFDKLLRKLPLATDEYVISLGKTMGAEEKLFRLRGNYYRTMSIRFFRGK